MTDVPHKGLCPPVRGRQQLALLTDCPLQADVEEERFALEVIPEEDFCAHLHEVPRCRTMGAEELSDYMVLVTQGV